MIKNTAGQKIGAQLVSAADGSAFSGSVTCYVCGDAGTQAVGSVGSGACAHEGNGYHTYAPAQAETNYDLIAFTFVGTGAIPTTVQVFTKAGDAFTRLGAPNGASVSADVAAVKSDTAAGSSGITTLLGRIIGTLAAGVHQPQSGDAFGRIGAAGAGLTAIGDDRLSAGSIRAAVGLAAADLDTQLAGSDAVLSPEELGSIATAVAAVADYSGMQSALLDAIGQYDTSHGLSAAAGTSLTVSGLIGAAATAGPRAPKLISDLFDEVRLGLRDENGNLYPNDKMTPFYNRAISECWHLMVQIGAEVAMNVGTIITDGVGQDYELPSDFRAFVPGRVLPRSPVTGTTDYGYGRAFDHVGMFDHRIQGRPSGTATPNSFCTFWSGNSQYIRFSSVPPAGEYYDFQYYPEYQKITVANVTNTFTPWLGLLDTLLARILEEFCREGLEFISQKRDMWRAKAENDIVMLLGLRHLDEVDTDPSLWRGFPG